MRRNLGAICDSTITFQENIINSNDNISSERWTPQIQSSLFLSYCCSKISELNPLDWFFMVFTMNTMPSWHLPSPDWHSVTLIVCFPLFIEQTSLSWQTDVSSIVPQAVLCVLYIQILSKWRNTWHFSLPHHHQKTSFHVMKRFKPARTHNRDCSADCDEAQRLRIWFCGPSTWTDQRDSGQESRSRVQTEM